MKCEKIVFEDLLLANEDIESHDPEIVRHLESCTQCQTHLAGLAANDQQWGDAQHWLSGGGDQDPEYTESLETRERWKRPYAWSDAMAESLLSAPSHPELLGRIGRYDVERLIGSGGMGVVFKAYDTELNRPVAVKLLAPYLASSGAARSRFAREARAAAAVVDDHVVPIHNVETDNQQPFLVMKFIAGGSLQQRLDRDGPLEFCVVLRIGMHAAKGLAAAHCQGLIHRDVKPSNILLDEGVERSLLTDFGLARATDDASLTRSGFHPGTPHYMSPEQVRGEAIDARSDLFGLGCVLYAMCTGHPPFRSETSYAVLRRITDDPPRPIRESNPDIPIWLEHIVMKLLGKNADDRFDSAEHVAGILKDCLAHVQQPTTTPLPDAIASLSSGRSRIPPVFKLAAAASFAFSLIFASVLIVLELNKGTLIIKSEADDIPIRIIHNDEVIERLTVSQNATETRVAAGKYLVEVDGEFTDLIVQNGVVAIKRGENEIVRISHLDSQDVDSASRRSSKESVDNSSGPPFSRTGTVAFGGVVWGEDRSRPPVAIQNITGAKRYDITAIKHAKVHLCRVTVPQTIGASKEVDLIKTFGTDELGRFNGLIPSEHAGLLERDPHEPYLTLVAEADGYVGYSMAHRSENWNNAMNFTLVPDEQIITGTIFETDGRPAKSVRVKIVEVWRSQVGLLDTWLGQASSQRPDCKLSKYAFGSTFYRELDSLHGNSIDTLQNAVTDEDGQFSLRGAGPNDILILEIEGKGIPRSWLWMIGRDIDRVYLPLQSGDCGVFYGKTFVHRPSQDTERSGPVHFGPAMKESPIGSTHDVEFIPGKSELTPGDRADLRTPTGIELEIRKVLSNIDAMNRLEDSDTASRPRSVRWGRELQSLVNYGVDAVPSIVRKLDETDDDRMIATLAFALRAIGDKRAVPALIRAIPRTSVPRIKCNWIQSNSIFDEEFVEFFRRHKFKGQGGAIGCSDASTELSRALSALTSQTFGFGRVFAKGVPKQIYLQQKKLHQDAEVWAKWWDANSADLVDDADFQLTRLPGIGLKAPEPIGPNELLAEAFWRTSNQLQSIPLVADKSSTARTAFLDLDTGCTAPVPEQWRGRALSELDRANLFEWAKENGFDVACDAYEGSDGESHHALRGIALEAWQIDDGQLTDLSLQYVELSSDYVSIDDLTSTGRKTTDDWLLSFDVEKGELDPTAMAFLMCLTSEGSPILLHVGAEITEIAPPDAVISSADLYRQSGFVEGRKLEIRLFDVVGLDHRN
ncbi:Serine/threonine protein kinase [Neorhodopirellula lusitana]|uniref:Serine/threonine protein kinase n=1 Tax=Neorhodopirellula lusitana TaxID=445327 RepID=A0ABY1Q2L1_9BACT|nr:serine/threonine-protein kinase [Neorhodopirellula lusitana]SMP57385.1 Serine/threonine protein kinase [Neorhodopirellula lusitana]